jgi:hypothetical protein
MVIFEEFYIFCIGVFSIFIAVFSTPKSCRQQASGVISAFQRTERTLWTQLHKFADLLGRFSKLPLFPNI